MGEAIKKDVQTIHDVLFKCTSRDQIKGFPSYVGEVMAFRKNDAIRTMRAMIANFVNVSNQMAKKFEIIFNQEYSGLNALLPNDWRDTSRIDTITIDDLPSLDITLPGMETDAKMAGGAVAGAAIGTAILPGVGTVLGGIIGAFAGSLFGPDLKTLQSQVWSEAYPKIAEQYNNLHTTVGEKIEECWKELSDQAISAMDEHLGRYQSKIEYLVSRDKKDQKELAERAQDISEDERRISDCIRQLNSNS